MKKHACYLLIAFATASVALAQDGAALYKSKCVACHGPAGAGKPALKGTNLLSDEAKKASDDALTNSIMAGGTAKKASHAFGSKGITADQAKQLVAYIRTLQK
jgi:mono/diheme cytochrome c family protein